MVCFSLYCYVSSCYVIRAKQNHYDSQPNLSASWLFQRAMSARENAGVSSTFINELLFFNFQAMQVN